MNALTPGAFDRIDTVPAFALGALGAVEVRLRVEVGAARLTLADLSRLAPGATFALDRRSDERIDILINDRLLAKGEVVTIGDRFGVRILDIVSA
ncbi:MAG: FliM/FliN family flagellar motor switch protein [Janthinobacterium lividum]